jgi:dTDP-4-amino-4,6-dideoxygalactose transaminase
VTETKLAIPISKPYFGDEERLAVQRPLESGWVVQGPFVREFEDKFAAFTGAPHACASSSCTTALHLAVAALGLKPGDEVIVPAFTWVATANAVEYMGARPVFCDIDLATFNIDPGRIEALITPRTVGILPVHLFGLCAEMEPILEIARRRGLWVIEDAACGFGAWYHGRHCGTFGDAGCFSFHPRKSITTGEGGMVTTADPALDAKVRSLRDHGATRSDLERHTAAASYLLADYPHLGYNYRMTDIQGAVGSVQMDRASWILEQRHRCAAAYDQLLDGLDWLTTPIVPAGHVHGYQSYVCLFRPETPTMANAIELHERRNRLMATLEDRGIATRQGTHAVVLQGFYAGKYGIEPADYPNAYFADRLSISLPLYAQLDDEDLEAVAQAITAVGP